MDPDLKSYHIYGQIISIIRLLRVFFPQSISAVRGVPRFVPAAAVLNGPIDPFSKLSRYEAAIERSLYRAIHELQRIQAARGNGQQPPSIAVDVTVDGPGPAPNSDD